MVKEKIIARRGATTLCSIVKKNLCTLGLLFRFFLIGAMVVAVVGETLSSYSEEPLPSQTQSSSERFEKRQFMIPMRDGVLLNTEVYLPKFSSEPVPFLLTRTPYGLRHDDDGYHSSLGTAYAELASDGYIFVFQDIRGRYLSDGTFVMLRSQRPANEPMAIDEGTDTYDTIEWLLKNIKGHTSRVGLLGISYGGWLTVMGMLDPHPALGAASPQASPADMFIGDDFLHNGALRLSPAFGYSAMMESGKETNKFKFDQFDTYEFYLDLSVLSNANKKYFHGKIPSWNAFMANETYTDYWKDQAVTGQLTQVSVPTLNVAGWWDAEDFYGPLSIYKKLEEYDKANENFIVIGPWRHGGWARSDGRKLGAVDLGGDQSLYFRAKVQAPFFAHYLKGEDRWEMPEALTFQTGSNTWTSQKAWPPSDSFETRNLYFHDKGQLSFDVPSGNEAWEFDGYVSDPANPVPYMPRPIPGFWQGGQWRWKVTDQRFVHHRPDVLSWETLPLKDDVVLAGDIVAKLFASTSGTDSDWIVKLIDVYPEDYPVDDKMGGFQLMIADEVLRAKFRNGFEIAEPVPADEVISYSINLNSRHHRFRAGHRIMVQVQSTWFPLIDRNPQTFVEIPKAVKSDYKEASQRIFRSAKWPSHLVLPVVR